MRRPKGYARDRKNSAKLVQSRNEEQEYCCSTFGGEEFDEFAQIFVDEIDKRQLRRKRKSEKKKQQSYLRQRSRMRQVLGQLIKKMSETNTEDNIEDYQSSCRDDFEVVFEDECKDSTLAPTSTDQQICNEDEVQVTVSALVDATIGTASGTVVTPPIESEKEAEASENIVTIEAEPEPNESSSFFGSIYTRLTSLF
jgi:hypothetical protein